MATLKKYKEELKLLKNCNKTLIISIFSIWINVVPPDGIPRRCGAYSGESLLDVIQRNNIPGIFRIISYLTIIIADCNGGDNELKPYQIPVDFYGAGVSCAQCSVVIPDPWYEKCNKTLSFE